MELKGAEQYVAASATTAGAASTFSIQAQNILVINDGANTCYFSISSTAGTTAGLPIKVNESVTLSAKQGYYTGISYITSTSTGAGPTATLRVFATR